MMVFELMEGGELFEDIVRRAFYSEVRRERDRERQRERDREALFLV
jgi:hypothetical protein